jgi:hypothetical protein
VKKQGTMRFPIHAVISPQAYGAVMMARVLTASANATSVARELVGDDRPLGALITMLASWEPPIRLAAVRALAKITWLVRPFGTINLGLWEHILFQYKDGKHSAKVKFMIRQPPLMHPCAP